MALKRNKKIVCLIILKRNIKELVKEERLCNLKKFISPYKSLCYAN